MSKPSELGALKIGSYILLPVGDQTTAHGPLAFMSHPAEITRLFETLLTAQEAAFRWGRRHDDDQTGVRRLRPTRRRLRNVARPLLVLLRARNPCCRLRRIFDG